MAEWVSIIGRIRRIASGGTPEHPIAEPEPPVDPDYGIDLERPAHPIVLPPPPPGVWPPPVPAHPIVIVPPELGLPPGMIWPMTPEQLPVLPPSKFTVLVWIPGYGYKYVVVDPSLKPTPLKKA